MKNGLVYLLMAASTVLTNLNCDSDPVSSSPSNPDNNNSNNNNNNNNGGDGDDDKTVRDIEGNVYQTVKIGNQIWTTDDLRTTKYNDGTEIPLVSDNAQWCALTTPAYCIYKNSINSDTIKKYGLLYDWYAVKTGKLAPKGWHVPSRDEWETLQMYLISKGLNWDNRTTGNKIAQSLAAKSSWKTSDTIGSPGYDLLKNNRSGFSALPVGARYIDGGFGNRGKFVHWWSSTKTYQGYAISFTLNYETASFNEHVYVDPGRGYAVRLVKD